MDPVLASTSLESSKEYLTTRMDNLMVSGLLLTSKETSSVTLSMLKGSKYSVDTKNDINSDAKLHQTVTRADNNLICLSFSQ